MSVQPRPKQKEILAYLQGWMGISAVPGSGKTFTLSMLAAQLISQKKVAQDQEILIVTLTNSAVDNFEWRIQTMLANSRRSLIPRFRVRTLHGLAHDIVRGRPDLAGLSGDFQIIDERLSTDIRKDVAQTLLRTKPDALEKYLDPNLEADRRDWVIRSRLPDLVEAIALNFIRTAKDHRWPPPVIKDQLEQLPLPLPLVEIGLEMYTDYQRALAYRGAVDFDDLIALALNTLEQDPSYLEYLQQRWPYILEDEAQDSSELQEQILRALTGETGNWVRVGDPNQAIYETFTTANPRHLIDFIADPYVMSRELPNSGRSTQSIIWLANYLIDWTRSQHPLADARDALTDPLILPAPPDDTQPNPPDNPHGIYLIEKRYTPQEELEVVADSLARWLPDHQDQTVAVLVPRNDRAFDLMNVLTQRKLEVHDGLLKSSKPTRAAAGALGNLLGYLSDPQSPARLATVYRVWQRDQRQDGDDSEQVMHTAQLLRRCRQLEDFLSPLHDRNWLETLDASEMSPETREQLEQFRQLVRRWHSAIQLPIDQLVLALAQDIFTDVSDLAIAHKLAVLLRQAHDMHPGWRLPELKDELAAIARNERRFLGFSKDDTGFDPDDYKGQVVVATVHKAKGLEWDRVYLMSVNNYNFPSGALNDTYISEKWYLRDRLNLEAEARAQLEAAFSSGSEYSWLQQGEATSMARLDYVRERLRLLYVGITRARRELVVTWNSGRRGDLQPAAPLIALVDAWQEHLESLES